MATGNLVETLVSELVACGLITAEQGEFCRQAPRAPNGAPHEQVVAELLRREWATPWQMASFRAGNRTFLLDGDRYLLKRELGRGGMGVVFLALHRRLQKLVALKLLPTSLTSDPRHVARFLREMEAIGRLSHPHIVQATDAGEFSGQHYLVMEYVDGGTLADVLRTCGPLRVADACEALRQAALGLGHIAENRLVHRDLKPSNLMLNREGVVKVSDLGLALLSNPTTRASPNAEPLTSDGQIMGTLDYMAPEQMGNAHEIDVRADFYALGCTLHALLTGAAPFAGAEYPTLYDKIAAHREMPPPDVATWRSDIPPELNRVLRRLLSKSPDDRPTTSSAVVAELLPFTSGHDLRALAAHADSKSGSAAQAGAASTFVPISSALTGTLVPSLPEQFASSATPTVIAPPLDAIAHDAATRSYSQRARRSSPSKSVVLTVVTVVALASLAAVFIARSLMTSPATPKAGDALPVTETLTSKPPVSSSNDPPPPRNEPPLQRTGKMRFDFNVQADEIRMSIDGESISPQDVSKWHTLKEGAHTIAVEAPGHKPIVASFDVVADVRDALTIHLQPLNVFTKPKGVPDPNRNLAREAFVSAIAESRVSAPDVTGIPLLIDEDFRVSRRMPQKTNNDVTFHHDADRYQISVRPSWNFNAPCPGGATNAPAVRVVGRAAKGTGGWFIDLYHHFGGPQQPTMAIRVILESGSRLRVERPYWQTEKDRGPMLPAIRHLAIKPIDQWNDLFVVVRNGMMELYVNGLAVCPSLPIDPDNVPAEIAIGAQASVQSAETGEFLSFQRWDADRLPQPVVRSRRPISSGFTPAPQSTAKPEIVFAPHDVLPKPETLRTAVDLSREAPMFIDELNKPVSGFPTQSNGQGIDVEYRDGFWALGSYGTGAYTWFNTWTMNDFVAEATARSRGTGNEPRVLRNQWSLVVQQTRGGGLKRSFEVCVNRAGQWRIRPWAADFEKPNSPHLGWTSHPAIRPGSGWNTVRVSVRNRVVSIHINGVEVCHPFTLAYETGKQQLGLSIDNLHRGETEFDRIAVWPATAENVPPATPKQGRSFDAAKERTAAAWVLANQGTVELLIDNDRQTIRDSASLPAKPFRVTAINLVNLPIVDDATLARFSGLTSLEWLNLEGCRVTGAGFAQVDGLDSLDWLLLHHCRISEEGLLALSKFRTVTHLGLTGIQITDKGLAALRNIPTLRALGLGQSSIADRQIPMIAGIKSLVELYMENADISGATLDSLQECQLLEKLHIYESRVTPEHANKLSALSELRMLGVDRTPLTGRSLEAIGRLKKLELLGLGRLPIENDDLKFLKDCTELRRLYLWQTQVSDEGLPHLAPLIRLRTLCLDETKITQAGLTRLPALPSLRELEVRKVGLPDEAWNTLRQRRPTLEVTR